MYYKKCFTLQEFYEKLELDTGCKFPQVIKLALIEMGFDCQASFEGIDDQNKEKLINQMKYFFNKLKFKIFTKRNLKSIKKHLKAFKSTKKHQKASKSI